MYTELHACSAFSFLEGASLPEAVALRLDHLQQREEHWAIVDLVGKGGHVRTVPVPDWVRTQLDDWLAAAAIDRGKLFRRVNKVGRTWGDGMTVKAVWHIVKESARCIGVAKLAPHDLRRTCARLCHASGGELEQIQFLLGHVSVQTTERYLGCKQRIRSAVNDSIGIEPNSGAGCAVTEGLPTIRPELIKGLGCQNISACSVAAINEQHRPGYVRGSVRSKKDDRSHNLGEAGTTT